MRSRAAIACAGFACTSLFFINLCNFIFECGCRALWAGADAHCNIHQPAALHPCPVCSHGMIGYTLVFLAIAAPQLAVAFLMKPGHWTLRLALVLLCFPAFGSLVMLAIKTVVF